MRLLQTISIPLLIGLWRYCGSVDVTRLLPSSGRVKFWESPVGLAYFDPMIAGDDAFYQQFYTRKKLHKRLAGPGVVRNEFAYAARHVPAGARVLDVGCGEGGFRNHVPSAAYTGLDPYFAATDPSGAILAETIEAHAERCPEHYDVVCAFQVIEHTTDPLGFARSLLRCVQPGGLLLVGVPTWPSPASRIPNFIINAPPHHLTWWNEPSLRALAEVLGLAAEAVETVPMSQHEAVVYWMNLVAPVKAKGPFFRVRWSWYASLAWSYGVGRVLESILPLPKDPGSSISLLAARRPA